MSVFDLLVRKQRHVEALVAAYLEKWNECLQEFRKSMDIYLEKGRGEDLAFAVEQTHRRESMADDLRRTIEHLLYSKALLPESRGDIMSFLESIDHVINRAETAVYILCNEGVELPPVLAEDFRSLLAKTMESTDILYRMARKAFVHSRDIVSLARDIDQKESECDHVERHIIRKIFRSDDLPDLQKILLRDLILKIGDISDQAQKVANQLHIMSIKRRV
jgi:predicted phosphate transport protein (TIGR00153 family)